MNPPSLPASRAEPSRPQLLMQAAAISFATCSYRNWQPWMGLPVRITVGPARGFRYPLAGHLPQLAPQRAWLKLDRADYEPLYLAKLDDELGPYPFSRLADLAREIRLSAGEETARLVLCCFEDLTWPGTWCHRTMAANWLQRAGIECPELTPRSH